MIRHLLFFSITFVIGAIIAIGLRTAAYHPYEDHRGHPQPGTASADPTGATVPGHAEHAAPPADHSHDAMPGMDMSGAATPAPTEPAVPAAAPTPAKNENAMPGMDMPGDKHTEPSAKPLPETKPTEHAHHDEHSMQPAVAPAASPPASPAAATSASETVNTICPSCGEAIDPKLPYADYKGKKIGFGCARCPPKFKADPVKYGEAALKNQIAE